MFTLQNILKKSLAKKHFGGAVIGEITLSAINDFFVSRDHDVGDVVWFVKYGNVFIKTNNQAFKIALFRYQKDVLHYVNDRLGATGYETKIGRILCK